MRTSGGVDDTIRCILAHFRDDPRLTKSEYHDSTYSDFSTRHAIFKSGSNEGIVSVLPDISGASN